ncbi:family 43 glycosylhydrolase [Pedobacter sp. AJM]|uniref:family 43 glycosylhydrolase n=1 Tax=Pedobacter sp. AJM TaxID=2003629 RepID=UPI000B4A7409|nr:family 43 glycosylhydrolase [Pedobacter sp. AJM]OWK68794.1 hypothetical protein CBW18_20175 [Pedobacter sp. AJM]
MKNIVLNLLLLSILSGSFSLSALAQAPQLKKGNGNPIIPGYFADPTVKKIGDTYYIYATTDGNGGGFGPSQVWTSKDFVNWTLQDMNWPTTHHYWAPDATLGPDGKYYLYYCQPVEIFGASSASPVGPWTPLLAPGKPIVPNFLVPNVITLDGQTFKDDDGKYYMYWGTWGIYPNHGCGVGLLNADMKSFAKLAQIPNTDAKDFFEAPFVFKRKGIYYLTYSSGYCEDGTYRVQYATATNPMGPFKYAAENPILATNNDGTVHGPGHQSVLQQGEDFYLIYHRHNNPHNDGGYHRQVAADKIIFDEKGNILKLIPTHTGIGYLAKNENPHDNLALGKTVTASSVYDQDFKAEYAVDDNNGTLWKPKNNIGPAWLQIDLGKVVNVRSVHTKFEYATWYYQYKIEYSLDGKTWKWYADKSRNTQHGSPIIDVGNVKARYIRNTILHTEYPGLNKAIWNVQVFDDASYRPVMNTAVKKWESLQRFDSRGLLIDLNFSKLRIGSAIQNIPNPGKSGGTFSALGTAKPIVTMIDGKKALLFSGKERLSSSILAPPSLLGNSSYTVSMWVLNPEIEKEETLVSWTDRSGDDLTNVSVGYGSGKNSGAAVHLGWADLGYKVVPQANQWHHMVMVFDGTMERIYVDGKLDRAARRMLFIKKLSHFLVGGNEDGTAGFSGALAALKVYDKPLSFEEIATAYAKGTDNHAVVYADAKNLDYGKLKKWKNHGTALGELYTKGLLEVKDVAGKVSVVLHDGAQLHLPDESTKAVNFTKPFSAVFSMMSASGSKASFYFGAGKKMAILGNGKWQQIIFNYLHGKFQVFVNGKLNARLAEANIQNNQQLLLETSGGQTAISSFFIYDKGLDELSRRNAFNFWKQRQSVRNLKASFASTPALVTPNMVYMVADRPELPGSVFQYLFTNVDHGVAKWNDTAAFIDFSVKPEHSYQYMLKVKDNFGNVTEPSSTLTVKTDSSLLITKRQNGNAQSIPGSKEGLTGTSWDGFVGSADTLVQQDGVLKMISHNTAWDGSGNSGPFAYLNLKGDFVAEVKLSGLIGLAKKKAYGANEAGIMVKLPETNHKLIQNGIMPGWGIGNIVTDLSTKGRRQFNNLSGWDFYSYLQIQRIGNTFFMRGSSDGRNWINLPGSPVKRDDLAAEVLEVGVYHATYGDIAGYGAFKGFKVFQKK